jgi:hypothetical protein
MKYAAVSTRKAGHYKENKAVSIFLAKQNKKCEGHLRKFQS